jgi:GNAT superfamily N-acetyltransferase
MSMKVVPLREEHLADAAALVSRRYQGLREQVPSLPPRYAEVSTLLPMLRDIAGAGPGVAAIHGGQLVGFLSGWLISSFRGKRSAFSPEWANAADPANSQRIYEQMYTHLSASWVRDGYTTHLISLLANDRDGLEGWHWLGFGMLAADAVRDLQPVPGRDTGAEIRRAGLQDLEQVRTLTEALVQYMTEPPIFLVNTEERDVAYYEEWLQNPDRVIWLAFDGAEAVAFMRLGPANEDASNIIYDEKTTSVTGAFTRERARGGGIASELLNRSLAWARAKGYERCAVDFEPMNPLATRFWLRHFQPVCYAVVRHVDERVA